MRFPELKEKLKEFKIIQLENLKYRDIIQKYEEEECQPKNEILGVKEYSFIQF